MMSNAAKRSRTRRGFGVCLIALALALAFWPARSEGADSSIGYKVKGGYIFNFARFIEWPEDAARKPDAPFVIAVMEIGRAHV